MVEKIPVYIISGFLGSGKTTVLLDMLKECEKNKLKPGIILNELGETNVEAHLFENKNLQELLNGCICCTIQEDLKNTLDKFIIDVEDNKVDILFIEGTGVANPVEIKEAIISPKYIDYFELSSIISLVDASNFLEYQSIFTSTAEVRKLMKEQVASATIVLLNKMDLVIEKNVEKIEKKIKEYVNSSEVPIYKTNFGELSKSDLFKKRYNVHTINIKEENKCSHHNQGAESCSCSQGHHSHNHSNINALKIDELPAFNRISFEKWLKKLPKQVLRGKGIIRLDESPGLFEFQFASGTLYLNRVRESRIIPPTVILIGDNLDYNELYRSFTDYFLIESKEH